MHIHEETWCRMGTLPSVPSDARLRTSVKIQVVPLLIEVQTGLQSLLIDQGAQHTPFRCAYFQSRVRLCKTPIPRPRYYDHKRQRINTPPMFRMRSASSLGNPDKPNWTGCGYPYIEPKGSVIMAPA